MTNAVKNICYDCLLSDVPFQNDCPAEKNTKTLSILRYRTFAAVAYFEKIKDKLVLKIAPNKKRRAWFAGLWNFSKKHNFPFQLSNA